MIDFNDWSEERAAEHEAPYRRLLRDVKPERQRVKPDGSYVLRKPLPERWWQYGEKRPALRKAIADLDEVLALTRHAKTLMPCRVSSCQILSDALVVFAVDSYDQQAILSSSVHQYWVIAYGSGIRSDPRYTPSDVFETFPRPEPTPELEAIGRTLHTERREIMLRRELGLTKLYNLVNDPGLEAGTDPDVDRMRAIHVELDTAVAAAYGWDDLDLTHGFHTYRKMTRWTVPPAARVEILDRLLEENHRRAAAEAAAAAASGQSTGGSRSRRGHKSASSAQAQEATLDI